MADQDHTWQEGDPVEAGKPNPTGILANIDYPEGKALLVPEDVPDEIKEKEAILVDMVGGVIYDLVYEYDTTTKSYKHNNPYPEP